MVWTRSHKQPTQTDQTQNQKSSSSKQLLKSGQEKNDHSDTGVTLVPKPDCDTKYDRPTEILPDSTIQELEQNLGDEQKCRDAVTKTTNTPPTGNASTKSSKRRQRARRKREMTKSNSNDETENSSPSRETTDPSVAVSSSVSPSKKKKPEKIPDKKLEEPNKDKENDDTDVGMKMTNDAQESPQDVEKPAVNSKEVIQLYKKESYNAQGELATPKGKPKSGRFWKTEQMNRFSGMKQDRPLKTSWQKKMQQKAEMKNMKAFEAELKEAKNEELERKKKYRAKKLKQKQENQRKSEVVQVISNTAKIKRMKKKQLRKIEMRSLPDSSKKQVFPS